MNLHLNKELFINSIRFTSQQMNIPTIYVEKDYWITFALFKIFNHEIGKDTIFKGGTALSKCYNLVERFSEDIDLVVLRREGESDNKLKSKLKTIGNLVAETLNEVPMPGITHKMGKTRKTAHFFEKQFVGDYGQVRDVIILESTWLGYYEPYTTKTMCSFVGQMMIENNQYDMAQHNGVLPFQVFVLEPTRTICEKIMSLVRFSYGQNPIENLKNKIRHIYDLHVLLKQKEYFEFLHSQSFDEMLLKVANDDVLSFKNNNNWLNNHPMNALIFRELENTWDQLKSKYFGEFRNLVYGEIPQEETILQTLKTIRDRIIRISWNIKI